MNRRTALLQQIASGNQEHKLPDEYFRLEYIESTGTQWIDSGVIITNNHKVDMVYHKKSAPSSDSQWVFGTRIASLNNAFGINYLESNGITQAPYYKWLNRDNTISTTYYNEKARIIFDCYNLLIDFSQLSYSETFQLESGTISNNYSLYLFANNNGGSVYGLSSDLQIYSCQIYDNNTLVRDFIPVLRLSDSKPGLYDLVTQQFFVNQGSGNDFLYPSVPLVKRLPNEYQEVEYIESSGEQYIDTDVKMSSNISNVLTFQFTNIAGEADIFGCDINPFDFIGVWQNYFRIYKGGLTVLLQPNLDKHTCECSTKSIILDNEIIATAEGSSYSSDIYSYYLFCANSYGTARYFSKTKLYSCKLYDNNILQRNFIPCYRISDSKPGLYDLINDVFYVNQGTGTDFTVGPNHDTYIKSTIEIPYYGNTTLSSNWLNVILNTIPSENRSYINKIIIPTDFIDINALWSYDFSNFPNATIYHGDSPVDFTTFTIRGSGELTSSIVESQVGSIRGDKLSGITKLVIDDNYTRLNSGLLDNVINNQLINVDTIKCGNNPNLNFYTNMLRQNNKIKTLVCNSITNYRWAIGVNFANNEIFVNSLRTASEIFRSAYDFRLFICNQEETEIGARNLETNSQNSKVFISSLNIVYGAYSNYKGKTYFNALATQHYLQQKNLVNKIGIIDGNNVYQNLETGINMNYPKLTSIDTEANIQLLTPADESIYLASDTGNLWKYSNNVWSNLFENYSATWYSDEDCTTVIQPTDITSNMTVYCKLVWSNPTLTINAKSGETTLTSTIVNRELAKASSNPTVVNKVVVPIDFTSYDSGSIQAIQNNTSLTNLRYLETTYEAGNMELDLQGDIVAKIVSIGKTLDEALVYAKNTFPIVARTNRGLYENNNIIIAPPYKGSFNTTDYIFFRCSNLVYIDKIEYNENSLREYMGFDNQNLIEIKEFKITKNNITINDFAGYLTSLKRVKFIFTGTEIIRRNDPLLQNSSALEELKLENFVTNFGSLKLNYSTLFTRQALVDLINSLGTPATQQTLTIGATNLAKLTADDIAIATAKNWTLQ